MRLLVRAIGITMLIIMATLAALGPEALGLDPAKQSLSNTLLPPGSDNWLGTDHLGRDMAARIISGARLSLSLVFLKLLTSALPDLEAMILSSLTAVCAPPRPSLNPYTIFCL